MTETEWLTSVDPVAMLAWARGYVNVQSDYRRNAKISDRKLRLFACACCRAVWDEVACSACGGKGSGGSLLRPWDCPACDGAGCVGGLTNPRSRRAVEVAERFADGEATEEELRTARLPDSRYRVPLGTPLSLNYDLNVLAGWCADHNPIWGIGQPYGFLPAVLSPATQSALLRDVVGNPFRVLDRARAAFDSVWYRWLTDTVRILATTIYLTRRFEMLPALADALEEAGCPGEVVLPGKDTAVAFACDRRIPNPLIAHLRGPGPHARGCWVLDLLLGKE